MDTQERFYPEGYFLSRILAEFPDYDAPWLAGISIPACFFCTCWENANATCPRFQLERYNTGADQYGMAILSDDCNEIEKR